MSEKDDKIFEMEQFLKTLICDECGAFDSNGYIGDHQGRDGSDFPCKACGWSPHSNPNQERTAWAAFQRRVELVKKMKDFEMYGLISPDEWDWRDFGKSLAKKARKDASFIHIDGVDVGKLVGLIRLLDELERNQTEI